MLTLASIGIQIGKDLLKMKDEAIDTDEINQKIARETQTIIIEFNEKYVQTEDIF